MRKTKVLLLTIFLFILCLSANVRAVDKTSIADKFNQSFVDAICTKYSIEKDEFTSEWAEGITALDLSNSSIGCIDKDGTDANVLCQYFKNLKVLNVSNNNLGGLPNLPNTLTDLNCSGNKISGLPNLPSVLIKLDCSNNKLPGLPELPAGLENLDCSSNELAGLPPLPGNLVELNCSNNKLPGLPDLPATLKNFNCSNNELPGLPPLPGNLIELDCSNNQLPKFLPLPATLEKFDCSDNIVEKLPRLPATLKELDCSNNKSLSTLPDLPNVLEVLNILNTSIAEVKSFQLPASLKTLNTDLIKDSEGNYNDGTQKPEEKPEDSKKPTADSEKPTQKLEEDPIENTTEEPIKETSEVVHEENVNKNQKVANNSNRPTTGDSIVMYIVALITTTAIMGIILAKKMNTKKK